MKLLIKKLIPSFFYFLFLPQVRTFSSSPCSQTLTFYTSRRSLMGSSWRNKTEEND